MCVKIFIKNEKENGYEIIGKYYDAERIYSQGIA